MQTKVVLCFTRVYELCKEGFLNLWAGVYSCRMFVCFSGATMMATNVQKIVVGAIKAHWLGSYVQVDDKLYLGLYHIRMKVCSNALKSVMSCDVLARMLWGNIIESSLKFFSQTWEQSKLMFKDLLQNAHSKGSFVESHSEISFLNHKNENHIFQSFNDIWNSFNYTSWNACDFQMVWWGRETLNLEASNVSTIAYNPRRSYLSIGVQWN